MHGSMEWCNIVWNWQKLVDERWNGSTGFFFSRDFFRLRLALQDVTWNIGDEFCDSELLSISGLDREFKEVGLMGEMSTAYGTEIFRYNPELTFKSYCYEFDCLTSSYPSDNYDFRTDNREMVTVGLVDSIVLAKHLGVEKLKDIRCYSDQYRFAADFLRREAVLLLLKQIHMDSSDNRKILDILEYEWEIPIFPYRMQLVALWDESTNWRVLQASAHRDIRNSSFTRIGEMPLFQVDPRPDNIFNYCAELLKDSQNEMKSPTSLGLVIETVRTFLAEWIAGGEREPDWEPVIPIECFEFDVKENYGDSCYQNSFSLIWKCQRALQKEVARTSSTDDNLPSNHALIMLFLLGYPGLAFGDVHDDDSDSPKSQGAVLESSLPTMHSGVDVSVHVRSAFTQLGPQDVSVLIRHDLETGKITLSLKKDSDGARFIWQDWVDAAMGYLKGFEENVDVERKYGRTIIRTDLREPMVELCPLRFEDETTGNNGSIEKPGTARIWMGWLPFDVKICKFEVEQWLAAWDINLSIIPDWNVERAAESEIFRAERLIESIVSRKTAET